ncbi:MAG: preprotein translocase subunit YajC [Opitutaceae bacterium]|nr:preprotein translocase subunit YajC [Opitutaceae bacterium]
MTNFPLILAQAAPSSGGPGQIIFFVLIFAAMWFLMIAPQRKKQKAHAKMLSELTTGDEIITNGGIFGVITNVKDNCFVVKISDNTKIELGKGLLALS